jgi:hypothetical protein
MILLNIGSRSGRRSSQLQSVSNKCFMQLKKGRIATPKTKLWGHAALEGRGKVSTNETLLHVHVLTFCRRKNYRNERAKLFSTMKVIRIPVRDIPDWHSSSKRIPPWQKLTRHLLDVKQAVFGF